MIPNKSIYSIFEKKRKKFLNLKTNYFHQFPHKKELFIRKIKTKFKT